MLEREFYVMTFDSTHLAISTEKYLLSQTKVEMVPTPREITASCGLSLKIGMDYFEAVMTAMKDRPKAGMHLYYMVREDRQKVATPIEWRE